MTLRARLGAALTLASLIPMGVAIAVPWMKAGARAEREAAERLERATRQAAFVVERERRDAEARLDAVARELVASPALLDAVLAGPEIRAGEVAHLLAQRGGLDRLEILDAEGRVLSSTGAPVAPPGDDGAVVAALDDGGEPGGITAVWTGRRMAGSGAERLVVAGDRAVGDGLVSAIAVLTGASVAIRDGGGWVVAPGPGSDGPRIDARLPLPGGSLALVVSVPAGDVRRERRDLLVAFGSTAPVALVLALGVGALVAERLARPITRIAERADAVSREHAGPLSLPDEPDEVRRLQRSVDTMLEALSRSEGRRLTAERVAAWREVARRVAHEVKNPLSPILLAVENLRRTREKAPGEIDRALREETSTIVEEVESLRRLVDEFSQFARLPRLEPSPCDLAAVIRQSLAHHAGRIGALGVAVEERLDPAAAPVVADAEQIARALKNVVANALDALEPVADRRMTVTLERRAGPRGPLAVVAVRDSGIGFEPDALRRVFEPYFTTRGDRGGTGLGMAIVYRIVADHGGTVEADGAPGRGASITLEIPAGGPPAVGT